MMAFRHVCHVILLLISLHCLQIGLANGLTCYVCSYTYTGVKEASYKCVSEPWNVTTGLKTMTCQPNQICMTKTVYTKDYARLNSFARTCGNPQPYNCGKNCCVSSLQNEGCQYECQTDLCNNNTKVITPSGSGNTRSGTGSVAIDKISFIICLFSVFFVSCLI